MADQAGSGAPVRTTPKGRSAPRRTLVLRAGARAQYRDARCSWDSLDAIGWKPFVAAAAVFVLCIAAAAVVVAVQASSRRHAALATLRAEGTDVLTSGAATMHARVAAIEVLAHTFVGRNHTHPMPPHQFRSVIDTYGRFGGTESLASAASVFHRVTEAERASFEAALGKPLSYVAAAPVTPVTVTQYEAGELGVYYPLVLPYKDTQQHLIGADFRTRSARRAESVAETLATGSPAVGEVLSVRHGTVLPFHQVIMATDADVRPHDGYISVFMPLASFATLFPERRVCVDVRLWYADGEEAMLFSDNGDTHEHEEGDTVVPVAEKTFTIAGTLWRAAATARESQIASLASEAGETSDLAVYLVAAAVGAVFGGMVLPAVAGMQLRRVREAEVLRAKASSQTKGRMLRVMNHELRNPLTVVRAGLDILQDEREKGMLSWETGGVNGSGSGGASGGGHSVDSRSDDTDSVFGDVVAPMADAVRQMQLALDDLLQVDVGYANTNALRPTPVVVQSLLRDVRHYVSTLAGEAVRIHVVTRSTDMPSAMMADRTRLRQVLVDVAWHAKQLGGDDTELSLVVQALDEGRVLVVTVPCHVPLSTNAESRLLAKAAPTEMDARLRELEWEPSAALDLPRVKSRPTPRMGGSTWSTESQTGRRHRHGRGVVALGALALPTCAVIAEAMGGTVGARRTAAGGCLFVAVPVETPPDNQVLSLQQQPRALYHKSASMGSTPRTIDCSLARSPRSLGQSMWERGTASSAGLSTSADAIHVTIDAGVAAADARAVHTLDLRNLPMSMSHDMFTQSSTAVSSVDSLTDSGRGSGLAFDRSRSSSPATPSGCLQIIVHDLSAAAAADPATTVQPPQSPLPTLLEASSRSDRTSSNSPRTSPHQDTADRELSVGASAVCLGAPSGHGDGDSGKAGEGEGEGADDAGAGAGASASASPRAGDISKAGSSARSYRSSAPPPVDTSAGADDCVTFVTAAELGLGAGGGGEVEFKGGAPGATPGSANGSSHLYTHDSSFSLTRSATSPPGGSPQVGRHGSGSGRTFHTHQASVTSLPVVESELDRVQVVVVDDERMIRRVVKQQLKRMSVHMSADLEDGDELVPLLESMDAPPTCVLLDIVMRRSDGMDVLASVRQHPTLANLPVYAMTSNVEAARAYREAGFNGLLGKPFGRKGLREVLAHCIASAQNGSASQADTRAEAFIVAARG